MKLLATIVLAASCGLLQAQQISVGVEGYMGSFDMSSLKEYQAISKSYIPFKLVQNFPVRPGVRFLGSVNIEDQLSTGLLVGFISTGSRLAYSDNTGAAYRDAIVNGTQFGFFNRYTIFKYKQLSLNARFNFGGVLSDVKLSENIYLYDPQYESKEQSEWRSVNFYTDLGIEAGLTVNRFFFKAFSSYEFGIPSDVKHKDGNETLPGEPAFDVDWSGFRAGIGIEYKLSRKE